MTRRRAAAFVLVLAAATAASAAFAVREIRLPGHRGAGRLVTGFVSGRWDARFLVARGPASVHLPDLSLRATLTVSGPARVQAIAGGVAETRVLGPEPEPWAFDLARGGRIELQGDRTLRLHGLRVIRTGPPSFAFARLAGRGAWDRARPVAVLAALALGMGCAALAGLRRGPGPDSPWRLPAACAAAVLLSCLAQVLLLPQPLIVGDPGAYYDMAGRFRDALRAPLSLGEALHDLRPYAGLAFTAALYGALRAVRDVPSTIYVAHALAMSGAVFFLVRASARVFGTKVALVVGVLAATYATFPVICGIVQPEPFILLSWCFAFDRVAAVGRGADPRGLLAAGLAFAVGLALHPQGLWYLLAAALLLLAPFAAALRRPAVRRGLLAFALGAMPVAVATSVGESHARPAVHVLEERYGFFAYTVPHPLGFWLFLETDGWQAAVRLDQTRYGRTFAAAREAGQIRDGGEAWMFTLRFVAAEWKASLRAVLRNLHRLYRRPDNPFHRAWLLPYDLQVPWHESLVVAFLLAVPLLLRSAGAAAVLPVAMLAATYPLYHVFNKYALPATPFLLLGAGLLLRRAFEARPRGLLIALGAAAVGTWLAPASLVFMGASAPVARWGLLVMQMGGLLAAFAWSAARADGTIPRLGAILAGLAALAALFGSKWDDPSWRAFQTPAHRAPRQEIRLDRDALAIVENARESYLALDLQLEDGDPSDVRLEFESGLQIPGSELLPTMPAFGLATSRGGRNPRTFSQWWIVPWRPEMSPRGILAVTVRGDSRTHLAGDVGLDEPRSHHGLSLGHWPHVSVYRLMHEGEYRLPVHQPLDGGERRSWREAAGTLEGTYRIRLVALDDEAGGARWETAASAAGEAVTAVWARAGRAAAAEMETPAGRLAFELGGAGPWQGPGGELHYIPTGEYEGWYVLRTRIERGGARVLLVRPRQGMNALPKYFLPELRPAPPLPPEWSVLPFVPAVRILEAREAPWWRPVGVY